MRYLFDCVRDKLCSEIALRGKWSKLQILPLWLCYELFMISMVWLTGGSKESEQELGLPLSVLEQAVNLLLVNKTVMSCILVLQNRARHNDDELGIESVSEMSATLVPEEVTKVFITIRYTYLISTKCRVRGPSFITSPGGGKGWFHHTKKNHKIINVPAFFNTTNKNVPEYRILGSWPYVQYIAIIYVILLLTLIQIDQEAQTDDHSKSIKHQIRKGKNIFYNGSRLIRTLDFVVLLMRSLLRLKTNHSLLFFRARRNVDIDF